MDAGRGVGRHAEKPRCPCEERSEGAIVLERDSSGVDRLGDTGVEARFFVGREPCEPRVDQRPGADPLWAGAKYLRARLEGDFGAAAHKLPRSDANDV